MAKPLWSIYYKKMINSKSERSTMVLFLFHQSFTDGVSLMRLLLRSIVDNRNQLDIKPRFGYTEASVTMLKHYIFGWSSVFYYLLLRRQRKSTPEMNTFRRRSDQVQSEKVLIWSDSFDLVLLHRLKLITRSKMNDFLVSVVAGVLRHYLQKKGSN